MPATIQDWAVTMFNDVGGPDWQNKLLIGGTTVIVVLLFIIASLVVYLAFAGHR